ncbi:hypothetical protein VTN31DRAFT_5703 [Thermomyces dupontii]|uniref:uncharacterized protein n=1 Tax=Talaromyces thermophilus TaxID=28565 RepID=UPI003743039C
MDAGGLTQMTYNNSYGGNFGVPSSGFASRGKASHIKPLNVPPRYTTSSESQPLSATTPRTSRSHLLAGLRTAPKSAHPGNQQQQLYRNDLDANRYANRVPQTANGVSSQHVPYGFDSSLGVNGSNVSLPLYTHPEQVLAPPQLDLGNGQYLDDKLYAELMSTNLYLAAQQQQLQQQLLDVTAAAQQFQNLSLGQPQQQLQFQQQQQQLQQLQQQQQLLQSFVPAMNLYQQQLQQGMQPVVQPVPGQPGLFSVFNPMTGQQNLVYDNSVLTPQEESPESLYKDSLQSPVTTAPPPPFRAEVSPPPESVLSPLFKSSGSDSPAKQSPSPPQETTPLPPPSTNAFRRGHRQNSSSFALKTNTEAARTAPRSAGFPQTPLTGTFGPGQGRAGEHPVRQPRGPPPLEELTAKPTSKHEGNKNFATRQRRQAVHSLVRAGIERRGESRSNHSGSGGSNTPASEAEFSFSVSDGSDGGRLSSKPSLGSLRAAANGAIGSEIKEKGRTSRERGSSDRLPTPGSDGGSPGITVTTSNEPLTAAAVVAGQRTTRPGSERRRTPMLVLSSAEKRKSSLFSD